MALHGDETSHLVNGLHDVHRGRAQPTDESVPAYAPAPSRTAFYPPLHAPLGRYLTSFIYESPGSVLYVRQCGPLDAGQLQLWADATLHGDFYFKKGHWAGLLKNPNTQVYAIAWAPDINCPAQQLIGIAITGNNTTLYNLYLEPHWRQQGLGTTILKLLNPDVIRAKTDSKPGDPTPFYERLGYTIRQAVEGKTGNILVLTRPMPQELSL